MIDLYVPGKLAAAWSFQNFTHCIATVFFSLALSLAAHSAPIQLDDSQLDGVSAGFVELTLTSNAAASGTGAVTITVTDVNIQSSKPRRNRRGRTRTVSTGTATAEAIGEMVLTETGYQLVTDEQLQSLRLVQRIHNSETGTTVIRVRINRHGRVTVRTRHRSRSNRRQAQNGPTTETNTLNVRVVTRSNRRNNHRNRR